MRKENPAKPGDPKVRRIFRGPAVYLVVVLLGLWLFLSMFRTEPQAAQPNFTELKQLAAEGKVETAVFLERDQVVTGRLSSGEPYETPYLLENTDELTDALAESGVDVSADPQKGSAVLGVLLNILPFLLIIALFVFFFRQSQGGGGRVLSFGKAKARQVTKDTPKTTFDDVAGVDEAIEELREVKEYLENPVKFQAMGAKIPKGVLLYGPPGTGKTLLARAVAGEAGVPFFSISGSDFVEMFVGVGAARVRDLFEQAKASAPAIVFIDEIDAVGRHRGAGLGGGHDEREQTLNQLLVEMDGFDTKTGVILMAGTNRPDILDPALLRPGRFDRQIVIDYPDLKGREGILKVHARGKPIDPAVDLVLIARQTPGFTGADLANVLNEAALLAARRDKRTVSMETLEEAIDRVQLGPERKSRLISDREKRIVAYHEAGHALVAFAHPDVEGVYKVTIVSRGRTGGHARHLLPAEDRIVQSRSELTAELAVALGGRVAEGLVIRDISTGSGSDLENATKQARRMVTEFGMSDKLGPMTLGQRQHEVFLGRDFAATPDYSDQVAFEVDSEVRRLIDEAHDEALHILKENREKLDALAAALMERETLAQEEIAKILEGVKRPPSRNGKHPRGVGVAAFRRRNNRRPSS